MRLRVLGCGTSSGVPRIGNDWGDCDPANPRNRRSRASIVVETGTTRLLVDTSPDLRQQLLAADVAHVDAVLWTHDHADHCHGIDDLRQLFHARGAPVPGYARSWTLEALQTRFSYAFEGKEGYPPVVTGHSMPGEMRIGDIDIVTVDQPHGSISSVGFRFENRGRSISYSTDFNGMTGDMRRLFQRSDIWVVDGLRRRPHPTHPHLAQTLQWIAELEPRQALLTHMDQSMDYATLLAELPPGVAPAYDGLEISVG